MATDKNNAALKIGDKVVIHGTVTGLSSSGDYHNCTVELDELLPPERTKTELTMLNTQQLVKADQPESEAPKTEKKAVK